MKNWEVQLVISDINAASQRFSADQHPADWVVFIAKQILDLVRNESQHGTTGSPPPDEVCAQVLRVKCAELKGRPKQRKACRQHPPRKFVKFFT
jgi:hypothetical protein